MRVTFLTHYYPPEVGAPQTRISDLARRLAERGARVTVHTCPPHYPTGHVLAPYRNRAFQAEEREGVRVVRSAVYPAANRGTARRLANHLSAAGSALATAPGSGPADVVIAETPPLFTAAAGVAYARVKRAALIVNVADRWPASVVELGALTNRRAIAAAEWLERRCYAAAAAITVPTRGLLEALSAEPAARGKVVHVPPAVDLDLFRPTPPPARGPLRVLYAGTVGMAQGLETLVRAARIAGPDAVHVSIAGAGAELALVRDAITDGTDNVELLGVVPHEAVPGLYADADVAAVLLRDRPIFRGALPTKVLEAMAAGRAVVLSGDGHGEAAELVSQAGAGVVVRPEDPDALAGELEALASDRDRVAALGVNARRRVADCGRDQLAQRWAELVASVAR